MSASVDPAALTCGKASLHVVHGGVSTEKDCRSAESLRVIPPLCLQFQGAATIGSPSCTLRVLEDALCKYSLLHDELAETCASGVMNYEAIQEQNGKESNMNDSRKEPYVHKAQSSVSATTARAMASA